jgi:hypothetical protein
MFSILVTNRIAVFFLALIKQSTMNANIKQYLALYPDLAGELDANVVQLLKSVKLKQSKINIINIHNYLINYDRDDKKR